LSLLAEDHTYKIPSDLGHTGQFFNSGCFRDIQQTPHAHQSTKLPRGLSCLSPSLPGRYCSGNNGRPSRLDSLGRAWGTLPLIINKMAAHLHIFLIDFPLPSAQAAQVSPNPPSCSVNTGQMERDSPSQLLAPTLFMSSGHSSLLPATSA
ncbi:hypothetical protein LEMLEM_LOCUS11827, partial [Lemmus lemmus]